MINTVNNYDATNGIVTLSSGNMPETLSANGWIRVSNGTNAYYGYYSHRTDLDFILGNNYRSNTNKLENGAGDASPIASMNTAALNGYKLHVWSRAGNLRWDNGFQEAAISTRVTGATGGVEVTNSAYDHFAATQVHFAGVHDAIDRTRAVGAVGWHGERYSYLNRGFTNYSKSIAQRTIDLW